MRDNEFNSDENSETDLNDNESKKTPDEKTDRLSHYTEEVEKEGKKEKKQSFEDRLTRLESIVRQLEKGETPLEESLSSFEEGVKLVNELRKELDAARGKVEILLKNQDGSYRVEEFKKMDDSNNRTDRGS